MKFSLIAFLTILCSFSYATEPKVVVVGAGIAGLTTAHRLQEAGVDVELYEARNRVGGRIFTASINGRFAELGAQGISDGGDAIHLNRLISEFCLQTASSRLYLKYTYFNGTNFIPYESILKNINFDPEALKERIQQLSSTKSNLKQVLDELLNPEEPFYKILQVRLAAYEGGSIDKLSSIYSETLFHMLLGGICSVHQANEDNYVDLISIEGGNSQLPQKMGEALGSKLHLNTPLNKVAKTTNGTFQLSFKNGECVEADLLVLAIPCSIYDQITFENGVIPNEKLEAIKNVQYGETAKIIVPFTTVSAPTIRLITDDNLSFFDRVQQFLAIHYIGSSGHFSPSSIENTYSQVRPLMSQVFENYPQYTHCSYAKDEANLSYEGPVAYSWPNDPYAKGSYSYIASGQEKALTDTLEEDGETFRKLFAPIQNLYFAGEHASILFDVSGTMEAACESGERTSRIILRRLSARFTVSSP